MAEDRMLSDEILLGLINKKGGGGGGTTNYNQLENKPQIGGVTLSGNKSASDLGLATETALADKADKSSVKTEFIGTTAEWNALTEEQKKAYDTYQITNDYTEGSGGLPDYSTTEQKTGQKWIDGKDIYVKTIECGVLPNNTTKEVSHGISSIDSMVKIEGVATNTSGGVSLNLPLVYESSNANLNTRVSIDDTKIYICTNADRSSYDASYVTLYYTKTT